MVLVASGVGVGTGVHVGRAVAAGIGVEVADATESSEPLSQAAMRNIIDVRTNATNIFIATTYLLAV